MEARLNLAWSHSHSVASFFNSGKCKYLSYRRYICIVNIIITKWMSVRKIICLPFLWRPLFIVAFYYLFGQETYQRNLTSSLETIIYHYYQLYSPEICSRSSVDSLSLLVLVYIICMEAQRFDDHENFDDDIPLFKHAQVRANLFLSFLSRKILPCWSTVR